MSSEFSGDEEVSDRRGRKVLAGIIAESPDSETPLEILKKRYAKGEITKEEFDQMKKDL